MALSQEEVEVEEVEVEEEQWRSVFGITRNVSFRFGQKLA
jgi:hypothetical protein